MLVSIKKQCCRTRKVPSKDNDMGSAIPRLPVRINYIERLTSAFLYGANGLSNIIRIINNEYELNWRSHCKLNQSTSTTNTRGTIFHLHTITKESQRSDFLYRTCKIVNRMEKHVNFMDTRGLKGRLLKCLWKFYNDHYDINNTCTWYPNCGCVSCKLNPKQF